MCERCDEIDMDIHDFEGSPEEMEAFDNWLVDNPNGTLGVFRETDEWAQAFVDADTMSDVGHTNTPHGSAGSGDNP